jgi:hypothetical protein
MMGSHHYIAAGVASFALALDVALGVLYGAEEHIGVWHGIYCALATAVTAGGDVNPVNTAGYVVMAVICVTVVPLFGATFSLFTSALTSVHVKSLHRLLRREERQP